MFNPMIGKMIERAAHIGIHRLGQKMDEALYEKIGQLREHHQAIACLKKGLVLLDLNCYEEALAAFEEAIELNPDFAPAYNNSGAALAGLNRYEEALAAFEEAIELNPDYGLAYCNKGDALNLLGRHEEALAAYDRAFQLDPNFLRAKSNREATYRELKASQSTKSDAINRCPYCQNQVADGVKFCGSCGSRMPVSF